MRKFLGIEWKWRETSCFRVFLTFFCKTCVRKTLWVDLPSTSKRLSFPKSCCSSAKPHYNANTILAYLSEWLRKMSKYHLIDSRLQPKFIIICCELFETKTKRSSLNCRNQINKIFNKCRNFWLHKGIAAPGCQPVCRCASVLDVPKQQTHPPPQPSLFFSSNNFSHEIRIQALPCFVFGEKQNVLFFVRLQLKLPWVCWVKNPSDGRHLIVIATGHIKFTRDQP